MGTLLTLWPGLWGLGLGTAEAGGIFPSPGLWMVFGVGAVAARSAGCIINDMWDRRVDARVLRTRTRPLAAGELSLSQAGAALGASLAVAALAIVPLNGVTQSIALAAVVPIAAYPLFKRFTHGAQVFLGVTFNLGAIMGYTAVTGHVSASALMLYAGSVLWTVAYDTVYAHQDKADDAKLKLKSMALWDTHNRVPLFCSLGAGALWSSALGVQFGAWAMPAALPAWAMAVYLTRVNVDDAEAAGKAFRRNVWIGPVMMGGILACAWTCEAGKAIASWSLV